MTGAGAGSAEASGEKPPDVFSGWRRVEALPGYRFQDRLSVARWRVRFEGTGNGAVGATGIESAAGDEQFVLSAVSITQAILQEATYSAWREAVQWRRMYSHEAYAPVVAWIETAGRLGVVERLPIAARPLLGPPQSDGSRPVDGGLGRALPERIAIPMIRKFLEGVVFLLEHARTIGPAPTDGAFLEGVYFLGDANAPRVKLASPYVGLAAAPDQQGRRNLGRLVALVARVVLTGRCDADAAAMPVADLRPGLLTQLPAWVDALEADDSLAAAGRLLEAFDRSIGQVQPNRVEAMYRPLA